MVLANAKRRRLHSITFWLSKMLLRHRHWEPSPRVMVPPAPLTYEVLSPTELLVSPSSICGAHGVGDVEARGRAFVQRKKQRRRAELKRAGTFGVDVIKAFERGCREGYCHDYGCGFVEGQNFQRECDDQYVWPIRGVNGLRVVVGGGSFVCARYGRKYPV